MTSCENPRVFQPMYRSGNVATLTGSTRQVYFHKSASLFQPLRTTGWNVLEFAAVDLLL